MLARRPAPPFAALPSPRPTPPRPRRPRGNGFALGSEHTPLPPGRTHGRGAEGGEGGRTLLVAAAFPEGPSVNLEEDGAHSPLHSGQTDVQFAHALSRRHPPARRRGQLCARAVTLTHFLLSGGGGGASPSPPASRSFCACSDPSQPRKGQILTQNCRFW